MNGSSDEKSANEDIQVLQDQPKKLTIYWKRLKRQPFAVGGGIIFLFFLLMAIIGPLIVPYNYQAQDIANRLKPPSLAHFYGTDQYGRDVFSRIIVGSRGIFLLGGSGTLLAVIIGATLGLLSGYYGGLSDEVLMRLFDVLLSIPPILLALVLLVTIGPSKPGLILVVALLYLPIEARVMRSMVLSLKMKEFVEAAKIRGEKKLYIWFREILPNTLGSMLVEGSMRFSYAIFLVASLGFLGLGVQPPSPDWGLQINEARGWFSIAPWLLIFPAGTISLLIIAANLMTDGLRHVFYPIGGEI
ncbi:MAG: ABC transporter permease [Spirochaetes bacterium]|nr:ABC transporter permease [Spirochaetota bacterium]